MRFFIALIGLFSFVLSTAQDCPDVNGTNMCYLPHTIRICTPYKLVYEDNFDGTSLSSDWKYDLPWADHQRHSHCHKDEIQYYNHDNNVVVENGLCKLVAKLEPAQFDAILTTDHEECNLEAGEHHVQDYEVTSAMIRSEKKFLHGKFSVMARSPKGSGFWPALWTWDIGQEIDIYDDTDDNDEVTENKVGTIKNDNNWGETACTDDLSQGFHLFECEVTDYTISFWIDGDLKLRQHRYYRIELYRGRHRFHPILSKCGDSWPGGIVWKNPNFLDVGDFQIFLWANLAIRDNISRDPNNFPKSFDLDWYKVEQRLSAEEQFEVCREGHIAAYFPDHICNGQNGVISFSGDDKSKYDYSLSLTGASVIDDQYPNSIEFQVDPGVSRVEYELILTPNEFAQVPEWCQPTYTGTVLVGAQGVPDLVVDYQDGCSDVLMYIEDGHIYPQGSLDVVSTSQGLISERINNHTWRFTIPEDDGLDIGNFVQLSFTYTTSCSGTQSYNYFELIQKCNFSIGLSPNPIGGGSLSIIAENEAGLSGDVLEYIIVDISTMQDVMAGELENMISSIVDISGLSSGTYFVIVLSPEDGRMVSETLIKN
jgi:hypothetical protein